MHALSNAPVEAGPGVGHASEPRPRTILLVEDEAEVREANAVALERAGYLVVRAESWQHALGLAGERQAAVDLILTDLVMPDDAGVGLFSELRNRCGPVPVIVLSAYPRMMRFLDGVLDGVVEWLQKPLAETTVVEAVTRALRDVSGPFP
jgi:DNA-binding NtrC family response regulator